MLSPASAEPSRVENDDGAEGDLLSSVGLPSFDPVTRDAGAIAGRPAPSGGVGRAPSLETGVVRGVASGILVDLGSGPVVAKRAKSCLVAPDTGDRVLCALDGDRAFVLAVLEGEAGAATRVVAEGNLEVQATGRLGLAAGAEVEISAAKEVGLLTGKLQIRAQAAVAAIEEMGLVGRSLDAHLQKAVVVAEQIETRADRLLQRAKQAFRFVEALDQVRAGVLDMRAERLAAIRGENTILAARTLAKLDGEQVKIG